MLLRSAGLLSMDTAWCHSPKHNMNRHSREKHMPSKHFLSYIV